MKRKSLTIILIIILLATTFLIPSPAKAEEPAFVSTVMDGFTFYVNSGQEINLGWGWGATTPGLVKMFLKELSATYILKDSNNEVVWSLAPGEDLPYWGEPYPYSPAAVGLTAPMPYLWEGDWTYPLGALDPGTYTLTFLQGFRHPVNDGYHVVRILETGERLTLVPSLYPPATYEFNMTIIVQ